MATKKKTDLAVLKTDEANDSSKEQGSIHCGIGKCRPSFLQACTNICWFTALYSLAGLSTSTLNVYIASQITTLEKQFDLSSSISGFLMSCNDIGFLLTTLFMSYLARRVHIPRALAIFTILFGISGLTCTIPFFVTRASLPSPADLNSRNTSSFSNSSNRLRVSLCKPMDMTAYDEPQSLNGSSAGPVDSQCTGNEPQETNAMMQDGRVLAIACLAVGMIMQGLAKSARQPFLGTYIDDNVPKTKTTLYLGILSSIGVFGPVLAFSLGGLFTKIYITLEKTSMSPLDPRWLGAWWLGFLVFGLFALVTAIPIFFFPRRLIPQPYLLALKQANKQAVHKNKVIHELKEFMRCMWRLLTNPVYMLVVMATCLVLFGIAGMMSFTPKYLETQFLIPAWQANIMLGVMNVLAASVGTLAGGFITSHYKFPPEKCLKMMIGTATVSTCLVVFGFFLGCKQPTISMGETTGTTVDVNLTFNVCHRNCACDSTRFFPTCGIDGVTYFSPCHAGCSEQGNMDFNNCTCIQMQGHGNGTISEATPGFCTSDCKNLYPYLIINFFAAFCGTLIMMPSFLVTIRPSSFVGEADMDSNDNDMSVTEADKPLAIGLSTFMNTLLGWFPGPVAFGRIVDSACLLWSSGCSGDGSCSLYDIETFRYRFHGAFIFTRVGQLLLYIAAFVVASRIRVPFVQHRDDETLKVIFPESEKMFEMDGKGAADYLIGDEYGDDFIVGNGKIYKGKPDRM